MRVGISDPDDPAATESGQHAEIQAAVAGAQRPHDRTRPDRSRSCRARRTATGHAARFPAVVVDCAKRYWARRVAFAAGPSAMFRSVARSIRMICLQRLAFTVRFSPEVLVGSAIWTHRGGTGHVHLRVLAVLPVRWPSKPQFV